MFNGFGNDDRIDEVNRWLADNPHICDAAFEFSAVRTPGAFTHITHLTGITISYHVSASWSNKQYAIVQLQKYRAFSFFDDIDRGTDALKANWLDSNPEARFVGAAAAYSSRESGGGSSSLQVFSAVEFPRRSSPSSQKQPEIPPRQAAPIGDKQETRGQNQQPQNQQARNQQPWNQQAQNHPYQNQQIQTEQAPNQKSGGQQPEKQNTANQQTKGNHDHGETQQPKKKKGTVRFVVILIILFLLAFAAGIGYSYYMDASSCSGTSGYVSQLAGICIEQYYKFINIIKK
ncbi:MAG: hypothetical protein LUI87_06325 [Lachnospiraceae bacterium]|nr:hypothetical protein [Lachnospiraceae bacterium]